MIGFIQLLFRVPIAAFLPQACTSVCHLDSKELNKLQNLFLDSLQIHSTYVLGFLWYNAQFEIKQKEYSKHQF